MSRHYNKNYGYPSTSDEGYFFSGTVDNYEFYPVEITIPENFIAFRVFFRDSLCNSVYSNCTSISNIHHVETNEDC